MQQKVEMMGVTNDYAAYRKKPYEAFLEVLSVARNFECYYGVISLMYSLGD